MCLYKQEEIFVLKKQKIFWQFYNINNLSFSLVLCVMTFFFARFSGNNDTYWKKGNVILVYENINLLFIVLRNNFQMLEMIGITYIPTKRFDQNLADSVIMSCQFNFI